MFETFTVLKTVKGYDVEPVGLYFHFRKAAYTYCDLRNNGRTHDDAYLKAMKVELALHRSRENQRAKADAMRNGWE